MNQIRKSYSSGNWKPEDTTKIIKSGGFPAFKGNIEFKCIIK